LNGGMRIESGSSVDSVRPLEEESLLRKTERGGRAPLAYISLSTDIGRGVEGRGFILDFDGDEDDGAGGGVSI
jgi:hypothetical protein